MYKLQLVVQVITLHHISEGFLLLRTNQLSEAVEAQHVRSTAASSPTGMQVRRVLSYTPHIGYIVLCIWITVNMGRLFQLTTTLHDETRVVESSQTKTAAANLHAKLKLFSFLREERMKSECFALLGFYVAP